MTQTTNTHYPDTSYGAYSSQKPGLTSPNPSSHLGSGEAAPSEQDMQAAEEAMDFFSLICELEYMLQNPDGASDPSIKMIALKLQKLIHQHPELKQYAGGDPAMAEAQHLIDAAKGGNTQAAQAAANALVKFLTTFFNKNQSLFDYILSHMNSGGIPNFSKESKDFLGAMAMIAFVVNTSDYASGMDGNLYENFFHNPGTTMSGSVLSEILVEELQRQFGPLGEGIYYMMTLIAASKEYLGTLPHSDMKYIIADLLNQGYHSDPSSPSSAFDYEEIRNAMERYVQQNTQGSADHTPASGPHAAEEGGFFEEDTGAPASLVSSRPNRLFTLREMIKKKRLEKSNGRAKRPLHRTYRNCLRLRA